jgi:hypothetical protein
VPGYVAAGVVAEGVAAAYPVPGGRLAVVDGFTGVAGVEATAGGAVLLLLEGLKGFFQAQDEPPVL